MNGNIPHTHCDPKDVYHNAAQAHLADVTQASSISLLGSEMSLWEESENLVRLLVSLMPFTDLLWPQVEFWRESIGGFQHKLLQTFTCPLFKFLLEAAEKLRAIETQISSCLDGCFTKERFHQSTFGGARKSSRVSAGPQPLCGANVRKRPKCETPSHTESPREPLG